MFPNVINDSDMIILESVESYLSKIKAPVAINPQEKLIRFQKARDYLYSEIVRRFPRVASYILSVDMNTDDKAKGLFMALYNHSMSPEFVDILMQYLSQTNASEEEVGSTGALLVKIMNKYIEQNWKEPPKPKKGEKAEPAETVKNDMSDIAHIQKAANQLLGKTTSIVSSVCCNLTHPEAQAIAAAIAMNNIDTVKQIILSDLPVTADLFDIIKNPGNLIAASLLLEKADFVKLSSNQEKFVDSLKRWVYKHLNSIPSDQAYSFLISVYGSIKPDNSSKYLIQLRDCSKLQYPNLHKIAELLFCK